MSWSVAAVPFAVGADVAEHRAENLHCRSRRQTCRRVRLAIADPPYPPNLLAGGHGIQTRASRWYATRPPGRAPFGADYQPADHHPDAAAWDDPERHRALLLELEGFDGWALASSWDGPHTVYAPLPIGCRVLIWHKPRALPTGHRIQSRYETVIVYPPLDRRRAVGAVTVPDVLTCSPPSGGFAGAKPARWSRWVLEALGYDPDTDTVTDLFAGSGAVGRVVDNWQARLELDG
jgi:hypothetical protein